MTREERVGFHALGKSISRGGDRDSGRRRAGRGYRRLQGEFVAVAEEIAGGWLADSPEVVFAVAWAGRDHAAFEIFADLRRSHGGARGEFVLKGALFLGAVDLAEIVDAGVEALAPPDFELAETRDNEDRKQGSPHANPEQEALALFWR